MPKEDDAKKFNPCFSFRNKRCIYTKQQRTSPAASWEQCLKYTTKGTTPCPKTYLHANNTKAPHGSNQSKKMRNAQRVKVNGRGWRKVNWRRFHQIQKTQQYRQTHGQIDW